jgi:hypothetical protein
MNAYVLILTIIDPNGNAFIRDIPMEEKQACTIAGKAWKEQQESNYPGNNYTYYRAGFLCVPTKSPEKE